MVMFYDDINDEAENDKADCDDVDDDDIFIKG